MAHIAPRTFRMQKEQIRIHRPASECIENKNNNLNYVRPLSLELQLQIKNLRKGFLNLYVRRNMSIIA